MGAKVIETRANGSAGVRRMRRPAIVLALALAWLAAEPPPAPAASGFEWGFGGAQYVSWSGPARAAWLDRTLLANGSMIRIPVFWREIAPADPPSGFDPRDPASRAYDWHGAGALDAAVQGAAARGLDVLLTVARAPAWAEGPGRPAGTPLGTWRPDPGAYGDFATALARRYSGRFAAPSGTLPRVRYYQAWNEPNLASYLNPQWDGRRPQSPQIYRSLLNAFYGSVKGVDPSNVVVGAGTAPNGDRAGRRRMRPLRFLRKLFCLRKRRLRPTKCPEKATFDVLSHHPIGGDPRRRAKNRDDVALPDFRRLKRVLRRAQKRKRVRPAGRKPIWATEIFWDTDPPDPYAISERRQARWISDAFHRLWRQGVRRVSLLQLRDSAPPEPTQSGYLNSYQSGVFFLSGEPKRGFDAVRFPFVARRREGGGARVWGVAPENGRVVIERKTRRHGWRATRRRRVEAGRVFTVNVRVGRSKRLRARTATIASVPWRLR